MKTVTCIYYGLDDLAMQALPSLFLFILQDIQSIICLVFSWVIVIYR